MGRLWLTWMLQSIQAIHRQMNNSGRSTLRDLPSGGTTELVRYHHDSVNGMFNVDHSSCQKHAFLDFLIVESVSQVFQI